MYVIGQMIVAMIYALMIVGAIVTLFSFFYAAWLYIFAADDREKTQRSRSAMVWSVVGLFGITTIFIVFRFVVDIVPNLNAFIRF